MFRYLEKYVGKYCVKAHYDYQKEDFPRDNDGNIDSTFDELYIPCNRGKGEIRHTYRNGILAYITEKGSTGKSIIKELSSKKSTPEFEYDDNYDGDCIIYFNANDIDYFAKVFGAKTVGKHIKPYDSKNLPAAQYVISKEDQSKYNDIISKIDTKERANFAKLIITEFDKKIEEYKGKKFHFEQDREKSGLDNLTYIHYVGLWEKFIRYARKRARQEYNLSL